VLAHAAATSTALDVANVTLEAVHLGGNPVLADAQAGAPLAVRFGVPLDRKAPADDDKREPGDSDDEEVRRKKKKVWGETARV
jgi:hypothetical protein